MTNKEAKRRMEICRDFLANNYSDMGEPNFMAFNMAIQALEQEPCEDAISRQAAEDAIANTMVNCESLGYAMAYEILCDLPSVTPKFTDTEIQKMQELEQTQLSRTMTA